MVDTLVDLRERVAGWRAAGARIALVPTMGNLHDGHYSLVELARRNADRVVVSVFVNPTQFGPGEDFERYPRTPQDDQRGLRAAGCDLLFRPGVATMYPLGVEQAVGMQVPGLSAVLCGAHRPGHFDGVATVVTRLFAMVSPDLAVFGRKDLQQLQLIRHLVTDLSLPLRILDAPTRREADGLAMSSRNRYLDPAQRALAPRIRRCLGEMLAAARAGSAVQAIEAAAMGGLREAGFDPDYAVLRVEARLAESLWGPARPEQLAQLVALIAARCGGVRLIDNLSMAEHQAAERP
ncbi:MAG: pantoate--beta-alanine ligase [Lysobacteraceae bacterium]